MDSTEIFLTFDRRNRKLLFEDKVVVNLSGIQKDAKATIYSSLVSDLSGLEVDFSIDESKRPFRIASTAFSTRGFIRAVMENRLEVEGMIVDDSIKQAYYVLCETETKKWEAIGRAREDS